MSSSVIYAISKKELITDRRAISLTGVITFTILTWLGAYACVPLGYTPVPITMQTLFVFLSGAVLGKKLGSLSQVLYIVLGGLGMPLFASGSFGILHLFGPTGGYIAGFVAANYIIGNILSRNDKLIYIIAAFAAAGFVILLFGGSWLAFGLGFGIKKALYLGVLPFIPGCIVKIAIAAIITKSCIKRSKQLFY